jgi:hypothetical protein
VTRPAALIAIACVALYAATLDHYFISDDFLNLERNVFGTLAEGLALFGTSDVDFYRPIPRLHFGVLAGFAGDRVVVWNVVGVLLHAAASMIAFLLAVELLGWRNRRAARYAGLAFALHFIHVEPVVWASGVTSLWVALFLFLSLLLFRRARRTGRTRDAVGSVLALAGALLSKETAVVFVPLLLVTTWIRPPVGPDGRPTRRWPTVREAAPYVVLLLAHAAIVLGIDRGGDASPYRFALGPHVVKNAGFFLVGGFLPIRYWEVQQLWAGSAGLGEFVGALAGRWHLSVPLLLGGIGIVWAVARGGRDVRGGFLWIAASSLPFLLLPGSGERFQYVSSFGACLVLGLGAQGLLRRHRQLPGGLWTARGIVLVGLLALGVGALDRQADWAIAGRWTRGLVGRWTYLRQLDPEQPLVFRGVPDAHRSAWVFRNGFSPMVRLFWEGRPYWREGEPRPAGSGTASPREMVVIARDDGTLIVSPANLRSFRPPGAQLPPGAIPSPGAARPPEGEPPDGGSRPSPGEGP